MELKRKKVSISIGPVCPHGLPLDTVTQQEGSIDKFGHYVASVSLIAGSCESCIKKQLDGVS